MAPNLILKLIKNNKKEFHIDIAGLRITRDVWKVIQKDNSYETDFSYDNETKVRNFRQASASCFGEAVDDKQLKLQNRYADLPFQVFCFLAPKVSPHKVESVPGHFWPHLVSCALAHIENIPIPDDFLDNAKSRLTSLPGAVANKFEQRYKADNRRELLARELKAQVEQTIQSRKTVEDVVEGILQLSTEFKEKLERVAANECVFRRGPLAPEHHPPPTSPSAPPTEIVEPPYLLPLPQEVAQQETPLRPLPSNSPPMYNDNRNPLSSVLVQRDNPHQNGHIIEGSSSELSIHNAQSLRNLHNGNSGKRRRFDGEEPARAFPQAHTATQVLHQVRGTRNEAEGVRLRESWFSGQEQYQSRRSGYDLHGYNMLGELGDFLPQPSTLELEQQQSQNQGQLRPPGYDELGYELLGGLQVFLPPYQQQQIQN